MMKFLLMMIFMIPLSFIKKSFWLNQFIYFMLFFMFFLNFSFSNMYMYISYNFGVDLLSFTMILLSLWICSLMILASESIFNKKNYYNFFMLMVLLLLISLFLTFSTLNLFIFYLFFEMSLIPTLILIIGWGYQPERIQAGMYLLFYTMVASLPMLFCIFMYYNKNNSLSFSYLNSEINSLIFYFCMNMVFFVKMPMYLVHLWLPKAHVEAPVSGSMILAGVMLKLGGYGMMRVLPIFIKINMKFSFYVISLSLMGGVLVSLICLRQSDMKSLIAYSSVAHMSMVLSGILTLNYWGLSGALGMMIAHGLCSSGLFCLVNITYERLMSRSLFLNKGLMNLIPSMSLWWFLLISSNMAAPASLNLLSEIMLINSLVSWSVLLMLVLMFLSFFSAVYSLYLYSYSQHGKIYSSSYSFSMGYFREYLLLFLHWVPLNLIILKSEFMVLW
uniref:NADH-ubiquinone oxidoreductase chain 4 n=1 Tax=Sciodrepoides watsoni TaxID=651990 RepID=A0A0S2M8G8_9COLE|nr:NADH dehydrogenase subunit 4 [Sciodrepoides watsoni]ALO70908.1 NADH deshydrogenase subunit 4 [Sciodrepoides watsoni]